MEPEEMLKGMLKGIRGRVFYPLETHCGSVFHSVSEILLFPDVCIFLPSMNEAVLGQRTAKVGQRVLLGRKLWKILEAEVP